MLIRCDRLWGNTALFFSKLKGDDVNEIFYTARRGACRKGIG